MLHNIMIIYHTRTGTWKGGSGRRPLLLFLFTK